MAETRRFAGIAGRGELRALNQLGTVYSSTGMGKQHFRKPYLDLYDSYYEMRAYSHLAPWEQTLDSDNNYIPVRKRQPLLQYNVAKSFSATVASKLVGKRNFPELVVEEDPDTTELLRVILKASQLENKLMEPTRRELVAGSVFVRFKIVGTKYEISHYLSKWTYPEFDDEGNLDTVVIKYIYEDESDLDGQKKPKKKWYKLELNKNSDILYDNPEYNEQGQEPVFKVVEKVDHNFGFVQGEWFVTCENPQSVDGNSLFADELCMIDELNYSMSQSSQAIGYNQDPQLALKNIDEDEVDNLVKSSTKAWNLGREGEASFLEAGMSGVETADKFRDKIKKALMHSTRVMVVDEEKITGVMSGKALEIMHAPLVDLVEEIRPQFEKHLVTLVTKMLVATLMLRSQGVEILPVQIDPSYEPVSIEITVTWPPIFAPTMEDLQKKVAVASTASSANLISRESLTRWLAKDFGVENVEEELQKIDTQKIINPFGGF